MEIRLRQLIFRFFLWLMAEILLGFLGLDDLADYGEYIEMRSEAILLSLY